jgi:hypothetical protein
MSLAATIASSASPRAPGSQERTSASRSRSKSRPSTAAAWATSRAGPRRSRRPVSDACSVDGTAVPRLAELEAGAGQLLDEERNALRAHDDSLDLSGRHHCRAGLFGDELRDLLPAEARQGERRHIRGETGRPPVLRPEGDQDEDGQGFDDRNDPLQPLRRARVGPVHVLEHEQQRSGGRPPDDEPLEQLQRRPAQLLWRLRLEACRRCVSDRGKLGQDLPPARLVLNEVAEEAEQRVETRRTRLVPLHAG